MTRGPADAHPALVAGQHGVDLRKYATLLHTEQNLGHIRRRYERPPPRTVAGVVGEVHRWDRYHLDADALQREHRRGVPDMTVGDRRLDGQNLHSPSLERRLAAAGIDMDDVGLALEDAGVAGFHTSTSRCTPR